MDWTEIFHVASLVRRTPVAPVAAVRDGSLPYCQGLYDMHIKSLTIGKHEPPDP